MSSFRSSDPLLPETYVMTQMICRGFVDHKVVVVDGHMTLSGAPGIRLSFGRIVISLEDEEALDALISAVDQAHELVEEAFGLGSGSTSF
ncbi:hypothetical protein [Nakamurella sp. PAMC28650]|uniref:hypothetical protein n=1 Tax=Nakamurella sp. PAMC28650 TaxID=2762325 RepID=UPI00164ED2C5|nr:hypothetical protein [Nakamurella sp. PAMC28650]QNK81100.1 hypothetical protein H7F38_24065 [Nakamurella sp. PAMC28650]